MTVNQIIKRAFERLKKENKVMTPEFYAEAFCKEAKAAGILVEDCNQVSKFTKKLDKSLQSDLKQYRVRTLNELVTFFIARLNRTNPTECNTQNSSLIALLQRVLKTVASMHDAELAALSRKSLKNIELATSAENIDLVKDEWINFLTVYDDSFLDLLKPFGKVNKNDIKSTIQNLEISKDTDENEFLNLALLFVSSFTPSVASSLNDELAKISEDIRSNPQALNSKSMQASIKDAIKLRISIDKEHMRSLLESLDVVLEKLSKQILRLIEKTDHSGQEITKIKSDLKGLEVKKGDDFKSAQNKLYSIASSLEKETKLLGVELKEHSDVVSEMEKKIKNLEKELKVAQIASREDALTKLYNKRALDEFLDIKEAEFKRYNKPYSVVFFDIDFSKKVNDIYGHDAGDLVLRGFAKVFKSIARSVDVVGRYGGEEFLALLSETDHNGAKVFAEKVRKKLEKSRFVYKDKKIAVTISAGLAFREEYPSKEIMMKDSDNRLYKAKESGRNKIVFD